MIDQDTPAVAAPAAEQRTAPQAPPAEVIPLPDIFRQIERDSRTDPHAYLKETLVPRGGE